MKPEFKYRAELVRIIDGDTLVVNIDLGLNQWSHNQYLRLYGLNTPELRGAERPHGLAAKEFVETCLLYEDPDGDEGFYFRDLVVETHRDKTGKYGRWLATVWFETPLPSSPEPRWVNLNERLLAEGYAEPA